LHVCLSQRDARFFLASFLHTRKFFFLFLFCFFFFPFSRLDRPLVEEESYIFFGSVCVSTYLRVCVWATNWSEAISLAQNLGKLLSANLNKVTNHTLLSSVCAVCKLRICNLLYKTHNGEKNKKKKFSSFQREKFERQRVTCRTYSASNFVFIQLVFAFAITGLSSFHFI
jgi:hypothetical protein